jgi:transcriptional regulator with XRE-family HTH domain
MISQWERGEQRPTLESLDGLLDALGVSLADLASTAWLVAREHGEGGPDAEDGRPEAGSPSAQAAILDRQLGQLLERAPGRLPAEALLVSVVRAARSSLLYQQLLASEAHGMQRALWELLGNVALPEPAEPAAAEAEAERQAEAEVSR